MLAGNQEACGRRARGCRIWGSARSFAAFSLLLLILYGAPCAEAGCPVPYTNFSGLVPLAPGYDYPGYDLQYYDSLSLQECLAKCVSYPGHACRVVTTTTSTDRSTADCWLKGGLGSLIVKNRAVSAYSFPCDIPETCGTDLCVTQFQSNSSVSCQCVSPSNQGFMPATVFHADYPANDLSRSGYLSGLSAQECIANCTVLDECVLIVYSPGTQECFLKLDINTTSAVADPRLQAYAVGCALNYGNCAEQACLKGTPYTCVDPTVYGFSYLSKDQDYQGHDIVAYSDLDEASCISKCAQEPTCYYAQTSPTRQHCWLKTANASSNPQSNRLTYNRVGAPKGSPRSVAGLRSHAFVALLLALLLECSLSPSRLLP